MLFRSPHTHTHPHTHPHTPTHPHTHTPTHHTPTHPHPHTPVQKESLVISKTSRSLTTCGCRIILCRWYSRVAIRTYEALRHCDQLLSTRCTLHATCGAQRQFLYFCTSKASKLSIRRYCDQLLSTRCTLHATCGAQRQRLYFCTSKASKLSTSDCGQSVSCRAAVQQSCNSCNRAVAALLPLLGS